MKVTVERNVRNLLLAVWNSKTVNYLIVEKR